MERIYSEAETEIAVSKPDKPDTVGTTSGYFQGRDVEEGAYPTPIFAHWLNMAQEELVSGIEACGLTLDHNDDGQLGKAFDTRAGLTQDNVFSGDNTFSGENTFSGPAYLSDRIRARYYKASTQSIGSGAYEVVNFGSKDFDAPGDDRVDTISGTWEFIADRAMTVRVSASVLFDPSLVWSDTGKIARLKLERYVATWADYSLLDEKWIMAAGQQPVWLRGTDVVYLPEGGKLRVSVYQDAGIAKSLTNANPKACHIAIEEV